MLYLDGIYLRNMNGGSVKENLHVTVEYMLLDLAIYQTPQQGGFLWLESPSAAKVLR